MHQEQKDVLEFHLAMDQGVLSRPGVPESQVVRLRGKLVAEEFLEFLSALFDPEDVHVFGDLIANFVENAPIRVDMPELADAIADLKYVLEGTNLAFGIDGQGVWEEVHAANMRKVGGPISPTGKRLKPPGWTPPNIKRVLIAQGWPVPVEGEAG